jgi:hypothetical protein
MSVLRRPMAFAATAAAVMATAGVLTAPTATAAPDITWVQCSHNGSGAVCYLYGFQAASPYTITWYVNGFHRPVYDNQTGAGELCPQPGVGTVGFRAVVTDSTGEDEEYRTVDCGSIPDPV